MNRPESESEKTKATRSEGNNGAIRQDKVFRRKRIYLDFLKGAVFILLILLLKTLLEHTELGHRVEHMGYETLQRRLSSEEVPIQLLDISDLGPAPFIIQGHTGVATPRAKLQELIDALDSGPEKPIAIGVDIDFSPDQRGYITPDDPKFFQHCSELETPVFLGVKRTIVLPPEAWLGEKQFEKLAAAIIIPSSSFEKMPIAIQNAPGFSAGPALGFVLGRQYQEEQSSLLELLHKLRFIELTSEKTLRQGGRIDEILVDYSPIEDLIKHRTFRTIQGSTIRDQWRLFAGKIVIIGDASVDKASSLFSVPGRSELGAVPDVYLHASTAYTVAKGRLYEMKWQGRLVIDLILSGSILVIITIIRFFYLNRSSAEVATHRLQGFLTIVVIVLAFVGGVWFVHVTRILWTDFILVFAALIFHPSIEDRIERLIKRTPSAFRKLIFKE